MRYPFPVLMIGLSVLIANPPASALDLSASTDLSAAKKKKSNRQYVHLRAAPQAGYAPRPWMDPSIAPDGRPYRNPYPPNVCSVDEGYGRFSPCTFRD
jgi:hypothetical protein